MKRWILAACALMLAAPLFAQGGETHTSYIQTTGHAEREIVPDEYLLSILLDERDSKGRISVEEQQRAMIGVLAALGIDAGTQLRTTDLSSELFRRGTAVTTVRYRLTLGSVAEVAEVCAALQEAGIADVELVSVSHSRLEEFERELRAEAMRDALERARTLAEAVGQKAGACFYVYDSHGSAAPLYLNSPLVRAKVSLDAEAAAGPARQMPEFRNIELQYDVQARFVLEP